MQLQYIDILVAAKMKIPDKVEDKTHQKYRHCDKKKREINQDKKKESQCHLTSWLQ